MEPNISVIILNWNGENDTIECIESLFISTNKNFNLIVIDNGSKQENFEKLVTYANSKFTGINIFNSEDDCTSNYNNLSFKEGYITIILNNDNLGFAKANNVGIEYALRIGSESVVLLNNDTIVTEDFINNLIAFSNANLDYVALTPKIFLAEPNDVIWNCGGKITWYGNRKYYYAGQKCTKVPEKGFQRITFITGCALFFRPKITGLLSEKFFFGEEDFEFSLRLKRQNLKIACVYNSIIFHKVGQTIKKESISSTASIFLHYASRLIDHKYYYKGFYKYFIRSLNVSYGFYLTYFKYGFSLTESLRLWISVSKYVSTHDEIPKDEFFRILNGHLD